MGQKLFCSQAHQLKLGFFFIIYEPTINFLLIKKRQRCSIVAFSLRATWARMHEARQYKYTQMAIEPEHVMMVLFGLTCITILVS